MEHHRFYCVGDIRRGYLRMGAGFRLCGTHVCDVGLVRRSFCGVFCGSRAQIKMCESR